MKVDAKQHAKHSTNTRISKRPITFLSQALPFLLVFHSRTLPIFPPCILPPSHLSSTSLYGIDIRGKELRILLHVIDELNEVRLITVRSCLGICSQLCPDVPLQQIAEHVTYNTVINVIESLREEREKKGEAGLVN